MQMIDLNDLANWVFYSFLTVGVHLKSCFDGNKYSEDTVIPRYINTCADQNINLYNITHYFDPYTVEDGHAMSYIIRDANCDQV